MARTANRHLGGPGNTTPKAAAKLGWPEHIVRGAVVRGEVETVVINGLHGIPDREIERLKALFGPAPTESVKAPIPTTKPDVEAVINETDLAVLRKLFGPISAGRIAQLRELLDQPENSPA